MADRRLEGVILSIGNFARHGCASVRLLRHYDAIRLLRTVHVDRTIGYRSYQAGQPSRLHRIDANGARLAGYNRELYIEFGGNRDQWVTELQELIAMG